MGLMEVSNDKSNLVNPSTLFGLVYIFKARKRSDVSLYGSHVDDIEASLPIYSLRL